MIIKEEYLLSLRKCYLFDGIDDKSLMEAVEILKGKTKSYSKGELVMRLGEDTVRAGILLKGKIESSFQNESFDQITVSRFTQGQMFGESLVCNGIKCSPVQVRAVEDSVILFIELRRAYCTQVNSPLTVKLADNLITGLAGKNLILNQKVRILSQKSLRDRIIIYIKTLPADSSGAVKLPFTQTALAEYLGVNRSALSRELGRMQNDGILKMSRDKLKLI